MKETPTSDVDILNTITSFNLRCWGQSDSVVDWFNIGLDLAKGLNGRPPPLAAGTPTKAKRLPPPRPTTKVSFVSARGSQREHELWLNWPKNHEEMVGNWKGLSTSLQLDSTAIDGDLSRVGASTEFTRRRWLQRLRR
ncbi:hypothetical protein GQ457_17G008980 [Hibiscus cannabinus]